MFTIGHFFGKDRNSQQGLAVATINPQTNSKQTLVGVAVGKIPMYRKLQREFLRLVPVERWKFFKGFSGRVSD